MNVLFVHRAFPAQFGRLALELTERYGWKCHCLVDHLSGCPTPSPAMLEKVQVIQLPSAAERLARKVSPWPQRFGHTLEVGEAVFQAVKARPELRPDLVIGHGGLAPTLFLRDLLDCPLVDFCEYYFATDHRDLTYRIDLGPVETAPFFPRCINAATVLNLVEADAAFTPSEWQRQSFPERFHHKIEVHADPIDTHLYHPGEVPRRIGERDIPSDTRVVTYVARGLESVRGFDLFMQVADRIARRRSDVIFVVVGDEKVQYGWDEQRTGGKSFKSWVLSQNEYDLSRFLFLGQVEPDRLADILRLSDLHLYLSVPFVLSWSLLDTLATGCVVLAGDVAPVREVIVPGTNGLLEPLFDRERLTETALRVLDDPAGFRELGQAARLLIEERFALDVTVPRLKAYFEKVASSR